MRDLPLVQAAARVALFLTGVMILAGGVLLAGEIATGFREDPPYSVADWAGWVMLGTFWVLWSGMGLLSIGMAFFRARAAHGS